MPKFKKFASKAFDFSLELLEAAAKGMAEGAANKPRQQGAQHSNSVSQTSAAARGSVATTTPVATKAPEVKWEFNPVEWVSHCPHEVGLCDNCKTRIKACIQFAVDAGVPGGFNFATGRVDPDVAACNNACTHKLINDCCANCLFSHMDRSMNQFANIAMLSSTAVGGLTNAAMGVGNVGAPIGTMRQDLHQRSLETQRQRDILQQQMANTPIPFAQGGNYGSGGGTWERQDRLAWQMGMNNTYTTL
ncbi:hypothetical protein TWF694_005882 [Orbilia ellipsospora]|uniref:Uncharacterized protein n=1 Tax=Orbilia ellipsospora TaxID=2528407 RepID=A0AAV9WUP8_9PEZI